MLILVHASPKTLVRYRTENLGVLCSPRRTYVDGIDGWPWAADNGAFSDWDESRYREMLEIIREGDGCIFVTAPDSVGDAEETLRLFKIWRDELADLPVAFVGQDGLEDPPWNEFSAFFVGGSTEWKLGEQARRLMREAKERGKWVHMGRVNTYQRVRYARWMGCDSIDGTGFSRWRDEKLPPFLNTLRQETLDGIITSQRD